MPFNQTQRPQFFEEQYLGAADLTAVVDYARIQQARHSLGAHTWGIALGLRLTEKPLSGGQAEVYIQPGYAWDGLGRPIIVLEPRKVPAEKFKSYVYDAGIDEPNGRQIEIWLQYDEIATQGPRPGFEVCDPENQYSRIHETFRIEVGERRHSDQHDPISVAGYSIDAKDSLQRLDPQQTPPIELFDESIPFQNFPDRDTTARWLVPMGYVRWKPNPNPTLPGSFILQSDAQDLKKSRSLRRYIGVVAESVQAADGVIRLRDRRKDYSRVQSDDLVWAEGSLRVEGDASLFGGRLAFRHTNGQDFTVPLQIQRFGDSGSGARALQVGIGPVSQPNNRFAVGPLKANGEVDEKFVVLSGGDIGIGTPTPKAKLHVVGGDIRWGNNSQLQAEQGGSIELGGDSNTAGKGTPYIDFHYNGKTEDFNTRIINDSDRRLTVDAGTFRATGNVTVAGKVGIGTESPTEKLEVVGNIKVTGLVNGHDLDAELQTLAQGLGKIKDIQIIEGEVKDDADPAKKGNIWLGNGTGVGYLENRFIALKKITLPAPIPGAWYEIECSYVPIAGQIAPGQKRGDVTVRCQQKIGVPFLGEVVWAETYGTASYLVIGYDK